MTQTIKPLRLNRNALNYKPSGIRAIADLAAQRRTDGLPVYPFHLGEPDFDTPEAIKAATIAALQAGAVHYPPNAGIPALREAIASSLTERYGFPLHFSEVTVTVGACEALTLAMMVCLEPGDDVVVPTPCWPNYLQTPELLGVNVKQVPMSANEGYVLDPEVILNAIGPKTRVVIINSPNNPTGAIANAQVLRTLLDAVRARGIWLVVDEIYHDIVFEQKWCSVLEVAREGDPLIYVNGFSKSYAMTGWRLGYVVAKGEVTQAMQRIHQALVTSVNSFTQYGALEALKEKQAPLSMLNRYTERRKRVLHALEQAEFKTPIPGGGFYVFPKVPETWRDGDSFAHHLLNQYGIAIVPGDVFGSAHRDSFRLCFACADDVLDEGLTLLVKAVQAYNKTF